MCKSEYGFFYCIYRALATRNWGASNALRQQGIDDNTTIVTYSVKYYYTKEFAEVTDDIELYMDQVITVSMISFLGYRWKTPME